MMRALLWSLALLGVLALGPSLSGAQQEHEEPPPPPGKVVLEAGIVDRWSEGDEEIFYLSGGVQIYQVGTKITASRAIAWTQKGEAGSLRVKEIYAEGNVVFKRSKDTLWAERLYYNLVQDKAIMVEFRVKTTTKAANQTFFVSAREARLVAQGRVEAKDISISTCSYGAPHYHLSIGQGALLGVDEVQKTGPIDIWPYESWTFSAEHVTTQAIGTPFFFVPALVLAPWMDDFPLRRLQYGHSTRFGYYGYSTFGQKILLPDEHGQVRPWGDVELELDWRQLRGGGYGANVNYARDGYSGYLKTYFLWDLGRDPTLSFNSTLPPLDEKERGRAHLFHRQDLDEHWRIEVEANYISDSSLLEEFFDDEFRQDKDPETAAYLRYVDGPMGAYFYEKYRLNSWQTQLEYMPKVDFTLLQVPLFRGAASLFYFSQRFDATRVRMRFADSLDLSSEETWRFDTLSEVSMPWDFGAFQVSPFLQEEVTYYQRPLSGESEARELTTAGARLVTQIHGTHPELRWDGVGLRGVRHVAEVELRYANTFRDTVAVSDLFPYQPIDQLTQFEQAAVSLRQRFLTRDETGKVFEFFNATAGIQYYPKPERDTVTLNPSNYEPPFYWIPLAPDQNGILLPRRWSNVFYEANFTPRSLLSVSAYGQLNPESSHEEIRNLAITLTPVTGLGLSVGESKVRGVVDAYSAGIGWQITPKWSVAAVTQYDKASLQFLQQTLVIGRDFHDFIVQVEIENNVATAEKRVTVGVVPKFLGSQGLKKNPLLPQAPPTGSQAGSPGP